MTDIVERLHRIYHEACADWDTTPSGLTEALLDAKVEIERLRLNVFGLTASDEAKGDIIRKLHDEIERLRAALRVLRGRERRGGRPAHDRHRREAARRE